MQPHSHWGNTTATAQGRSVRAYILVDRTFFCIIGASRPTSARKDVYLSWQIQSNERTKERTVSCSLISSSSRFSEDVSRRRRRPTTFSLVAHLTIGPPQPSIWWSSLPRNQLGKRLLPRSRLGRARLALFQATPTLSNHRDREAGMDEGVRHRETKGYGDLILLKGSAAAAEATMALDEILLQMAARATTKDAQGIGRVMDAPRVLWSRSCMCVHVRVLVSVCSLKS